MAWALLPTIVLLAASLVHAATVADRDEPEVVARFLLEDTDLGASQARTWPGRVTNDRGISLGGIFSGLTHSSRDPENVFTCVGDRGPNGEVTIGSEFRRTFPVPEYGPVIYRVRAHDGRLQIAGQIGIRTRRGLPVTGLPNRDDDEVPYRYDGLTRLDVDPNGLDVEGLAIVPDGSFWIADEYRPSLAHVDADGTVQVRLIPRGVALAADTRVEAVLPEIYARRRPNRGFESVALSPDGSRLVAILESPLDFPDRATGRASRMNRLLVVDWQRRLPVAEHLYVMEAAAAFGASAQHEMRVSDACFVDRTALLVVERTPHRARIYRIDLAGATNILGGMRSDPARPASAVERLAPKQLRANGVVPVRKTLVVDLTRLPEVPHKIEGLALVNDSTIAIGNDNDFGFTGFDRDGRAIPSGVPSVLTLVRLP